ncbi:MAG: nucleoside 2-deoxyribosyltransferase [Nanoarchaeota archaeon]
MVKAYIAGLLWEETNRKKLEQIDELCKSLGIDTYLPHRDGGIYKEGMDPKPIFKKDKEMIDWSDFMVAVLSWESIGSGTAWELGYAYAKEKPIIGVVEDKKSINKEFRTCVMCFNSANLIESLDELKKELVKLQKKFV